MRAVNLIPADQRTRRPTISTGAPFLALMGGLVVVLAAVVLFVVAHNRVESRRTQLASVQARTARWSGAAESYTQDLATNKLRQATIDGIETLVGQRTNWSELLGQLAGLMPAHSQLSSLTAASSGATTPAATTTSSAASTPSSTGASGSGGSATSPSDATAAAGGSSIQIAACAASQTVVAETMIAFRRITGVSQVSLAQSNRTSSGSKSSGGCAYPVSFTLTLAFTPPTFAGSGPLQVPASDSSATHSTGGAQ